MLKAVIIASTIFLAISIASPTPGVNAYHRAIRTSPSQCAVLNAVDMSEFIRVSKVVSAAQGADGLREKLQISSWPEDSVQLLTDAALCARLDSLVVAWLAGEGNGTLTGVNGTIGPISVARIGTTTFHVRPGSSVPVQPIPHYPYFVVDTAAPTRVAYWGQSGG